MHNLSSLKNMPCHLDDLRALAGSGVIALNANTGPTFAEGRTLPASYDAMQHSLGWKPHEFLLRLLYLLSGGREEVIIDSAQLAEESGWESDRVDRIAERLERRELLVSCYGRNSGDPSIYNLTGEGIEYAEEGFTEESAQVKMEIRDSNIGAIQTGQGAMAVVTQNTGVATSEILELVAQARAMLVELPDEERRDAGEQLDNVEEELKKPSPKWSKVRAFLAMLCEKAVGFASFLKICVEIKERLFKK